MISTKDLGCWKVISVGLTNTAVLGVGGTLFVETGFPALLAAVFLASFSFTLLTNSSLHLDGRKWSTLTWNLFSTYFPRTLLCRDTPTARGFTLKTRAVRPW